MSGIKDFIALDNPFRLAYHKAKALYANIVTKFPSSDMICIGVTGTNGKTTTCNLIGKTLKDMGEKVFMFTTVNIIIDDEEYTNTSKMTSPDPVYLQQLLKKAKEKGCKYAIIETSSHSILMNRNYGINYDIAVLTNITQDHLDLHKTMKNYVNTKLVLFKNLITSKRKKGIKKTAVINANSEYKDLFLAETYDTYYAYGTDYVSNVKIQGVESLENGTRFSILLPGENLVIQTPLVGMFNVYNVTAAISALIALGFETYKIKNSIEKIKGIPGRMEEIKSNDGYSIFVDYAHTPDALEKTIGALKSSGKYKRVITLFGATGDRDKTKRPEMGRIVSRNSDIVILTQDDDYTENPHSIIKDVLPGIERKEGENFWIIVDREEAIRTALIMGKAGDAILIAGKGDEHTMVTNEGVIEWHDKTVVEKILHEIDENKLVK